MHGEQTEFVESVKQRYPHFFTGQRVLEVGSRNVNGSIRSLFDCFDYVGLDCAAGEGVDVVCLAHEYAPRHLFDVVISCEAFEHDPHLAKTVPHILSLLRPGGLFIATMASPLREEHGTRRVHPQWEPFGPDPDYYYGVSACEFSTLIQSHLAFWEVTSGHDMQDTYAVGIR